MKALSVMVMGGVAALSLILSGCGSGTSGNEAIVMAQGSFSGAIFTTDSVGNVNINIFSTKEDVYLNGGPAHPGAAGLPDGAYYGQVTAPNGDVLGRTDGPAITVTGGVFASNYKLWDILFYTDTSGAFILDGIGDKIPGFEDSPNNVYKAWVSTNPAFPNPASKTDNFKVNVQIVGGPPPAGTLQVNKFYDARKSVV